MRASLVTIFVLAIYAYKESDASGYSALYNPVFVTFPKFQYSDECAYNGLDISLDYRRATYNFIAELYKLVAARSHLHAVVSPMSVWMMLAAMAEGAEGPARYEIFKALGLPEDKCQRQQYYEIASKFEIPGPDATFIRTRLLAYDEGLELNKHWTNYVRSNCLLNTIPVPMKRDRIAAETVMKNLINAHIPIADFRGNSALLDSLDYQALWTTAFSDAVIENAPFCNDAGEQIGFVDMMRMKKRVRMMYLPGMDMKVLELPVGFNGRYRLMIGYGLTTTQKSLENFRNTIVFEILDGLRTSRIPIDIAIPRFTMTSEYDMRPFLEEMGIRSIWSDSYGTRNISEPAAKPSAMLHRVTVTFDQAGTIPNRDDIPQLFTADPNPTDTGLDPILGRDFIANRPFMFGLLDSETYSITMGAYFSRPTSNYAFKK